MLRAPPPPSDRAAAAAAATDADDDDDADGTPTEEGAGCWRCLRCGEVRTDAEMDAPCRAPRGDGDGGGIGGGGDTVGGGDGDGGGSGGGGGGGGWPGDGGTVWPLLLPDGGLLAWEASLGDAVLNLMDKLMTPGASRSHPRRRRHRLWYRGCDPMGWRLRLYGVEGGF